MKTIKHQRAMPNKPPVYIVTGAAGFIGSNICKDLLLKESGALIIGIDNINEYYSPIIKQYRLATLKQNENFIFYNLSISP